MGIRMSPAARTGALLRRYAAVRAARQVSLAVRRIEAMHEGTAHYPRELEREFGRSGEPGRIGSFQLFMY